MSHVMNVLALNDPYLGALEWDGYVWTDNDVWRDPVSIAYHLADDYAGNWTSIERAAFANAFQSWANVANITFYEVSSAGAADLIEHSVSEATLDAYGMHGTPEDAFQSSNQFEDGLLLGGNTYAHGYFNFEGFGWDYNDPNGGLNIGGNGFWTLIHELGHGLGLAHPHDDGGNSFLFPGVSSNMDTGTNGLNQGIWTVMSYIATQSPSSANTEYNGSALLSVNGSTVANYGYYAGPMAYDIAAIQDLYGANANYNAGSNVYYLPDANALGTYWTCIWDTGGTDTIAYTGSRNCTINLNAATLDGSTSGGGMISWANNILGGYTIANGVVIENATGGSGSDSLTGNAYSNTLTGGAGADTMRGNAGDDTYFVDSIFDQVIENFGQGNDWVRTSTTSYTLGANIENLDYNGPVFNNFSGTGNSLNNIIQGWGGNDVLNGGAGADTMRGYGGNDTFWVDNTGDVIDEALNNGSDWVFATIGSYTLGANVENLNYMGPSSNNFVGTGNSANNEIVGWNGNDTIDGKAGADTMRGYGGNDTFWVDDAGDVVDEWLNNGIDWVFATIGSYTLGANVENLNYMGPSSSNFTGTGNGLDNIIYGWAGNDTINGKAGADTMKGFGGNDTFYVDNTGDRIDEWTGGGTERVYSTVSFALNAGAEVEQLLAAAKNITLQGNEFNNGIYGNSGNETLYGLSGNDTLNGKLGADKMYGGVGNDTYYVDNAADAASEAAGEGTADRVFASVNYALSAGSEVESLIAAAGTTGLALTGNEFGNTIKGSNGGNDVLKGLAGNDAIYGQAGNDVIDGGLGVDTLFGGAGADIFVFSSALGSTNIDRIRDFSVADDTIRLDRSIFTALAVGPLAQSAFVIGTAAQDADDRIIYNSATGVLTYDANGNAAGGATRFGVLSTGLALTATDFVIA